jgi:phage tail-like protein
MTRSYPYGGFRFQVLFDDRIVAGFSTMSSLETTISPGVAHGPVTLGHGLTQDPTFERWANRAIGPDGAPPWRDLTVRVLNAAGGVAVEYRFLQAWVPDFQALPDPDASGAVAFESLTLEFDELRRS